MEVNTYMRSIKKQDNALLYHLEDLVISVPKTPTPEQIKKIEQRAEDLIKKLKAGTDFKSLAVAESTGQTALQGGDLGWYSLAELPATFSSAI
jgi:peptidyl-prolyl cis-trans isomerase SurA